MTERPSEPAAATGYLVRCTVCGRERTSGASPLSNGWPKCCGYTMRLEDTERFVADVDEAVARLPISVRAGGEPCLSRRKPALPPPWTRSWPRTSGCAKPWKRSSGLPTIIRFSFTSSIIRIGHGVLYGD